MKRLFLCLNILIFSILHINATQITVDYYGVLTTSDNTNILKMAQDIFYTQLCSIDNITTNDKRLDTSKTLASVPNTDNIQTENIIFYAEITEEKTSETSKWLCKLNAYIPKTKKTISQTEEFDSYYKILVNAKDYIDKFLIPIKYTTTIPSNYPTQESKLLSIESLAGTWDGEPFTDKIIILRGGRGFIIFKNGSTMNISVSMDKNESTGISTINITQVGKSNASFYPALPREKALEYAANAKPIKWKFTTISNQQLIGTKETLVKSESNQSIAEGIEKSIWTKKN